MTPAYILEQDQRDPLAHKRDEFVLPADTLYMDGNSLGVLPKASQQRAIEVVQAQWGQDLITSWNKHSWIDLPVLVGEKIAPLIGAEPGQVICCDSISVNLFKLLSAAMKLQEGRYKVLTQQDNFPTDLYMVQGLGDMLGEQHCELVYAEADSLIDAMDEQTAVLMLTHVNFRSGLIHDMAKLTQAAHAKGILVIWDLAHSAGALPVALDACDVDFAVGCGYKYLNGGPGAPAFVYVASRLQAEIQQPLSGWMGHVSPFAFSPQYQAAPGVEKMLCGTPSVISMSVLDAALDVFADVDMLQLREKSVALCELFISLVRQSDALQEMTVNSPVQAALRGSQVALCHPHAYAICQALIAQNVIPDFRAPNILRFGFTPLYTRYEDVWRCVSVLVDIVQSKRYLSEEFQRQSKVT